MGSLFSSPGKQATSAAQAAGGIADSEISKLLGYTDTHQQELRDAIGKQGPNPYFDAAQQLNPQAYYTNPRDTVTFGTSGPGMTSGHAGEQGSPFAPPPPNVILSGPTSAPNPVTPTPPTPHPPIGGGYPGIGVPGGAPMPQPPGPRPIIPPRERM